MSTPGKLQVDTATGHVTGPAALSYNSPFPCVNGQYGSGAMMGVLMHTQVGNNPGTVSWFNNPQAQASAHFCIAQDGSVVQMGPIGKGWEAWHAAEANPVWYGIEHADDGNPANPLTSEQITASAQLVECLSGFAGFPLQVSDSPSVKGYGWHGMGGVAWGDHPDCPGDVRKAQRPQIVALAMAIRSGGTVTATASPASPREWVTAGESSLAQLAATLKTTPAGILRLTAVANQAAWPEPIGAWLNDVFDGTLSPAAPMPEGLPLIVPGS
jgi:N-acetylmuramoyl-L-alanine amidase